MVRVIGPWAWRGLLLLCFVILLNRKCLTLLFGWSCEGLFGGFLSSMVSPGGRGCSFIFGCGRCSRGGFMMSTGGFYLVSARST